MAFLLEPDEILRHWEFPLLPLVSTVAAAGLYLRGWLAARRTRPHELPVWRAQCFFAGLLIFWLAVSSPITALDDTLLSAHMFQHFLLMSVAPPLVMLGAPTVPWLRGLPRPVVRRVLRPLLTRKWIQAVLHVIAHPATIWLAMNITYLGWHLPAAFELTFVSEQLHDLEHAMFFFTSCAFWWVVISPWPARPVWPRWAMIPYLLSSDILNTILCALLAFSGRVLYHSYAEAPRVTSLTPLQDQVAAGCEMWVLNSSIFLGCAVFLTWFLLSPRSRFRRAAPLTSAPTSRQNTTAEEVA